MSVEESRHVGWGSGRIVPALVVIAIGVFFLLGNLDIDIPFLRHANWWAWFILLGALGPLWHAMEHYRRVGSIDGEILHSLLTAAVIVWVAVIFIAQLSWSRWWPVFVIYGGLVMLVRSPRRRRDGERR